MRRKLDRILVTGGCGFIGTNFIRFLFNQPDFTGVVVNVDKLTYAGNPLNLTDIEEKWAGSRYFFCQEDICDQSAMDAIFDTYAIDTVVHFAAESHVDRSIHGPAEFIHTNIMGTFSLLEAARKYWKDKDGKLFHHVSTDEVYGSLGQEGYFTETTPYDPRSPYSASKAGSDHLVNAYCHTYGLPVTMSNCSNNYGPYQFPEKLIPFMILSMLDEKPLPVYGDGGNIRDWLHVDDHCSGIWAVMTKGEEGQSYNIGGDTEKTNIDLVKTLCRLMNEKRGKPSGHYERLISFVQDRPGHDRRYAIDCSRIKKELGWQPSVDFSDGLTRVVAWYLAQGEWVSSIKDGSYRSWIEKNYAER